MYKKNIMIFMTLFSENKQFQMVFLLFLSGFYYYITKMKKPFIVSSQNHLENWSNFSAFFLILAGNFLITIIDDTLKEILITGVLLFALYFLFIWIFYTFEIVFYNNLIFFRTNCFGIYSCFMSLRKSLKKVNYKGNFINYLKDIRKKYRYEKAQCSIEKTNIDSHNNNSSDSKISAQRLFKKFFKIVGDI